MRDKPAHCGKVCLAAHLLPGEFCLLAVGLDETPNAFVFDEVNSAELEKFKNILKLYSSEYQSSIWMYQDRILETELRGCQLRSVSSYSKPDTLAIVTDSFLKKKKMQIGSSLSLRRKLAEFKGQNPSSQVLALFCAVEQLQGKLNGTHEPRKPLVSIDPRPVSSVWQRSQRY